MVLRVWQPAKVSNMSQHNKSVLDMSLVTNRNCGFMIAYQNLEYNDLRNSEVFIVG